MPDCVEPLRTVAPLSAGSFCPNIFLLFMKKIFLLQYKKTDNPNPQYILFYHFGSTLLSEKVVLWRLPPPSFPTLKNSLLHKKNGLFKKTL